LPALEKTFALMSDKIQILLVEDNPVDAALLKEILLKGKLDYTLDSVETLEEALELLEKSVDKYDSIILDLYLPDSEGLATFQKIHVRIPEIPVVIYTSLDDEQVGIQAMRDGAQDYLVKGQVDVRSLIRSIRYGIERKQTEEALRESEARYRSFISQSSEGIARWEIIPPMPLDIPATEMPQYIIENTYIAECNDAFARRYGFLRAQETIGLALFDLIQKESSTYNLMFAQLVESGYKLQNADFTHTDQQGNVKYFRTTLTGMVEDNLLHRIWCLKRDVTQQKKTEEALRKSEAQLKEAQSVARIGSWILDVHEGRFSWSDEMFRIFRLDPSKGAPSLPNFQKYVYPREWERFEDLITQTTLMGSGSEMELGIFHPDGLKHTLFTKWKVQRDENGEAISLVGTMQDITERKSAEKELELYREYLEELVKTRTSELEGTKRHNELILNSVGEGIYGVDNSGNITFMNPAALDIMGMERAEAIGLHQHYVFKHTGPNGIEYSPGSCPVCSVLNTGHTQKGEEGYFKRMDNTAFPVEYVSSPIMENENLIGAVVVFSDITNRMQLIGDLKEAKDAAELATRAKSEFLANMSHEIRTPMNAIIGFSDLLRFSVTSEKSKSQLDSIRSSAKNLLGLINDILDLSKIEAGKLRLEYEPVNIMSVVREIECIFSLRMGEKNLAFQLSVRPNVPQTLIIDEVRIRQMLFNLIGNAVKFTEKGYIKLSVGVENLTDENVELVFKIEDTGIGIRLEQQQVIFEAFNQQVGQSTKKYGGTGLGLTITKRFVEMMGGTITVKSEVGTGSVFEIRLPDVKISANPAHPKEDRIFDPSSVIFERASILVCDDNETDRKLISHLLDLYPMALYEASDGKEAIELAQQHVPDLILMDVKMPVMNGLDAVEALKSNPKTASIPVIMITASAKVDMAHEKYFSGSLIKPINLIELVDVLKKVLPHTEFEPKNKKTAVEEDLWDIAEHQEVNLEQLVSKIENEILPVYYEIEASQNINQIETFGKNIIQLSEKTGIKAFAHFGKELCSYAEHFEIMKLLETLRGFPRLVEKCKSLLKNKNE
jgi:PAS domain S-box-containing protein